jgi:transcriptional regulator with XRE-family HTH domain
MEVSVSEHISRQLAYFRRDQNLTQGDLAELLNVTAATISRWESNAQSPDPQHIVMIENLLGIQRLNSLDEWRFRVSRSLGYEVLFDARGNVAAASVATLSLNGLTPDMAPASQAFQLLPPPASTEAEAEYRRNGYFVHRPKLFEGQIRLIKFTAEVQIPNFSNRISAEFWPIFTSNGATYALFTFTPVGPIHDTNWKGAYRILKYEVFPVRGPQAVHNAGK